MAKCLLSNALAACCLPFLNAPGNRRARMSSQAQKSCFSNFSENFTPSAGVPGHAMHSIPPGCLFSTAWGVTKCQQQHFASQSASPSSRIWAALHLWAQSGCPSQTCSARGNPTPASEAPLLLTVPSFTFLTMKLFPSFPHQETLWGPRQNQMSPGDFVALWRVRRLGLRDGPAAVGG